MIGISKITAAAGMAIILKEIAGSKIYDSSARVNRTATLNGGAVIDNLGYSDGDRTFEITTYLNSVNEATLWSIFKTELFVNISTRDGFFYGSIRRMKAENGRVELTLLVQE